MTQSNDQLRAQLRAALRQADASGEWREIADAVAHGLRGFVELLARHHGLDAEQQRHLLRLTQVHYLRAVAALDPEVARALQGYLQTADRTMAQIMECACRLQVRHQVHAWGAALEHDEEADPRQAQDVGHVGRILNQTADTCRARLGQWRRAGLSPKGLGPAEFELLGQDLAQVPQEE